MPRTRQHRRDESAARWMTLLGLVALLIALLTVVVFVTSVAGPYGPWRYLRGEDAMAVARAGAGASWQ